MMKKQIEIHCNRSRHAGRGLGSAGAGVLLALAACVSWAAGPGDQLWRFYAEFAVTVVVPIPDLSGNGGKDVLVGSQDDSLYLVEGRGPKAGNQIWSRPFKSTLSAAAPVPDLNGDGKPDVVGGDEFGLIGCYSGATGDTLWLAITFGTILSLTAVPDVNGDNIPDIAAGSENDSVYMFSGKQASRLGKPLWQFGYSGGKIKGPPNTPGAKTTSLASPPRDGAGGANSLAQLNQKGGAFGLAVGTSSDTVYCLALANGAIKWKAGLPGDIWKIAAFPDQDGDGIDEVLAACGANTAYLLKGSTGEILWSHPVSMGAITVAVSEDVDGDGKHDALIGDGGGQVHCVSGAAKGADVKSIWTYNFGDTSTILTIAPMPDLNKDGKPDCAVGTSSDLAALLDGSGGKSWSVNLGGEVTAVADIGDVDGNGSSDMAAGTLMGFASALFGGGTSSLDSRAFKGKGPPRDARAAMRHERIGFGIVFNPGLGPVDFDAIGRIRPAIKMAITPGLSEGQASRK
ncbi:MAG: FG-GAP-like repeat-containing protein [Fibrobacterota bacterium]|nr:FG-GAP-like repeat-containing protein [Fibrobacterota bacterium]